MSDSYDHTPKACELLYWHVAPDTHGYTHPLGGVGAWVAKRDGRWVGVDSSTGAALTLTGLAGDWVPWRTVLNDTDAPLFHWFDGGFSNACFQNVDKHLVEGRGSDIA